MSTSGSGGGSYTSFSLKSNNVSPVKGSNTSSVSTVQVSCFQTFPTEVTHKVILCEPKSSSDGPPIKSSSLGVNKLVRGSWWNLNQNNGHFHQKSCVYGSPVVGSGCSQYRRSISFTWSILSPATASSSRSCLDGFTG